MAVTAYVWIQEWQRSAQEAAGLVEGREAAVAGLAARLERGLALLGATAVEDRLQEGVPGAIATLLRAGLKVPAPLLLHPACVLLCTVARCATALCMCKVSVIGMAVLNCTCTLAYARKDKVVC